MIGNCILRWSRLFCLFLLAGLLAVLPAHSAGAESLDWMPADDAIGFWGAKLPTPAGEPKNGDITGFYIEPRTRDIEVSYGYETDAMKCKSMYNLKKNEISHHECIEMAKKPSLIDRSYLDSYEYLPSDSSLRNGEVNGFSIFSYSCVINYGFAYIINGIIYKKSLMHVAQKKTLTDYDLEPPRDIDGYCKGNVQLRTLLVSSVEYGNSILLEGYNDVGLFVLRVDGDGDIPFVHHRDDLVLVDFDELKKKHSEIASQLIDDQVRGDPWADNFAEGMDAILTPYFREIKRRMEEQRQ